jgi:DNA-binding CsgD family transcriptional regulator
VSANSRDTGISPTALLTALALAREHGDPRSALRRTGLAPVDPAAGDDFAHLFDGFEGSEALALGFLAGRAAHWLPALDVSSFLMDRDLVVRGAEGRSILELPWFEDDLFVARQLPDIAEMPPDVRRLCVEHYRAALRGETTRFAFTSYGLQYRVDALPTRGADGRVIAVLALARPGDPRPRPRRLTARELEVLRLAADGLSGPEIAERLVVSPGTVKTHFQNIYAKLGVSERAGAVAKALRQGLIG